jgi:hypothetical protein
MYQREHLPKKRKRKKAMKWKYQNRELTTGKIMIIFLERTLKMTIIICTDRILHLLQNCVPTSKIFKHCFVQHPQYKITAEQGK